MTTDTGRTGHRTRGHQRGDKIIMAAATDLAAARIRRRRVLGGLISDYQRAA
jgi:hypothetical protein